MGAVLKQRNISSATTVANTATVRKLYNDSFNWSVATPAEPYVTLPANLSALESEEEIAERESLLTRMKYRVLQSENSAWASACLFVIILLIFVAIMKTQLWKKYTPAVAVQLHDDVEYLSFQSASNLLDGRNDWKIWFRRKRNLAKNKNVRKKRKNRRRLPEPNPEETVRLLNISD